MSERKDVQNKVVDFINHHKDVFNARYGIEALLLPFGTGYKRSVFFGTKEMNYQLDIISPNRLELGGNVFNSVDKFINYLKKEYELNLLTINDLDKVSLYRVVNGEKHGLVGNFARLWSSYKSDVLVLSCNKDFSDPDGSYVKALTPHYWTDIVENLLFEEV